MPLEAFLLNHRPALQAAVVGTAMALTSPTGLVPMRPRYRGRRRHPKPTPREEASPASRQAPWGAIYKAMHALQAQGTPVAVIARRLGISRPTVYAYLRRDTAPGPKQPQWRPSAQVLTPSIPDLIHRWRECVARTDSVQLWREIQALGDPHSARTVCRFLTRLRRAAEVGQAPEAQASPYTRPQGPSARAGSFAMICPAAKRSEQAQMSGDQRCHMHPSIARAYALSQAFLAMVRERRGQGLAAWMAEATSSGIEVLARFARGLQDDLTAVTAGLTLAWSNEHMAYCTSSPAS
jgi:transposase